MRRPSLHAAWLSPLVAATVLVLLPRTAPDPAPVTLEARVPAASPAPAAPLERPIPRLDVGTALAVDAAAGREDAPPATEPPGLVVACPDLAAGEPATLYVWPEGIDLRTALDRGDAAVRRVAVADPAGTPVHGLAAGRRYAVMAVGAGWISPTPEVHTAEVGRSVELRLKRLHGARLALGDRLGGALERPDGFIQDSPQESRSRPHGADSFGPSSVQAAVVRDAYGVAPGAARDLLLCSVPDGAAAPEVDVRLSVPGCLPVDSRIRLASLDGAVPVVALQLQRYADRSGGLDIHLAGGTPDASATLAYAPAEFLLTSSDHAVEGRPVRLRGVMERLDAAPYGLDGVPAGTYRAELRPRLWRMLRLRPQDSVLQTQVEVDERGRAAVEFDLGSVGTVDVDAILDTRPWERQLDVEVRLRGEERWCPVRWRAAPYRLDALPAGEYELRIRRGFLGLDPALAWPAVPFLVEPGRTTEVQLSVPRGGGA